MSNNQGKNWFSFGWHPAEEDLLLCLDGEASERQAGKVRVHLEGCWACRNRRDKFDRAIATFMDYCEAEATDASTLPPRASLQFAERLRVAASTQPKPSHITRWTHALHWLFAQRQLAVVATACLLLVASLAFILLRAERPVSAHELLLRTTQAETLSLSRVGEPVVYRKLQVKRVGAGEPVMWESWNDAQRNQFRQRVADQQGLRFLRANEKATPAILAELEQIFRANHFDLQRPLSAAAFAEWRKSIKTKAETVVASRAELKLTTLAQEPSAANAIIEASLIVRKSDWHAIVLHLKVQGENEIRGYELSEAAYEVLPREALTVFADLAPTPSPFALATPSASPARIPVNASSSPSPSLKALPTEAALREAEVAALYALHQAQADLGEQIEVMRDSDWQIAVRGLVETDARKRQLTEALNHLPLVTVKLQSVEEAARQPAPPSPRATEIVRASEPANQVAAGANAFEKKLAQYFAGQGESQKNIGAKIAELSNVVIVETAAAKSEAWALRRLAERFPLEKEGELSPAARRQMAEIIHRHSARLRLRVRHLQARLEPALSAIGGERVGVSSGSLPNESTWQAQALTVFKSVEQVHQLAGGLFAAAGGGDELPEQAEQVARQMLGAVARLDGALLKLERQITQ